MSEDHRLELPKLRVQPEGLGFFRFGRLGERVVLTNDVGDYLLLSPREFEAFIAGERAEEAWTGFSRQGLDIDHIGHRLRQRLEFLGQGPTRHTIVPNSSRVSSVLWPRVDGPAMKLTTAKGVVDFAFQSKSSNLLFRFAGPQPHFEMPTVRFAVAHAREKNRYEGKELFFELESDLVGLNDDDGEWLAANMHTIWVRLAGPRGIHDRLHQAGSFDETERSMRNLNQRRSADMRLILSLTVTRLALDSAAELVDYCLAEGVDELQLKPLRSFGLASHVWSELGCSPDQYGRFYKEVFDLLVELDGDLCETAAVAAAQSILFGAQPIDLRSPAAPGIGELAYDPQGRILPSLQAVEVAQRGDECLILGSIEKSTFDEVIGHPTTKTILMSSLLDSLPSCSSCWNVPFCGVDPIENYMHTGDLFGQRPLTLKCKEQMSISHLLLGRMVDDPTGRLEMLLRRWVSHGHC
ncbi:MAG: hypothetical protein HN348_10350 [Proteobacteria bacterium]|nr:hypothetical protein [Pseudomonadota bacterium]